MSINILWVIFGVAIGFFIIGSILLSYHWHEYGHGNRTIRKMKWIYYTGALLSLAVSFFFIISL